MKIYKESLRPMHLVFIFSIFFIIYNINLIPSQNGDVVPAGLLPFSIIINHNLYLDPYYSHYVQKLGNPEEIYFLCPYKNHYISRYPITLPVAITPIYVPFVYFLHLKDAAPGTIIQYAYVMGKFCASLIAALSVVAFYVLLVSLFGYGGMSIILAIAYAIGTTIWSQASQLLWQHGFGCLMILLGFIYFLRANGRSGLLFLSGLAAALAVAERYNNVFAAALIAVFVIVQHYKRPACLGSFFLGPFVIMSLLFWYNLHFFNNLKGGYYFMLNAVNNNTFSGIVGVLVSPSRGLFIYSPFLIFSIIGLVVFFKNKEYRINPLFVGFFAIIAINIFLIAMTFNWWGGYSYGPRLLTEIVPFLILFIPFARGFFDKSKIVKVLFGFSIVISIIIHGIGIFCYPKGMSNVLPKSIDEMPSRLWDIKNSQIVVEARAGLYSRMMDILFRRITGRANTTLAQGALPGSGMRAEVCITSVPTSMIVGYSYRVPFTIVNRSLITWPALAQKDGLYGIVFSYYWHRPGDVIEQKSNGNILQWDLDYGDKWSDDIIVTAPTQEGTYILGFDLFQTGVGWFHDRGSKPAEFAVTVNSEMCYEK